MTSRLLALKVRPANIQLRNNANRNCEEIPICWLLCEWPPGKDEPTKYWLSNLPPDTFRCCLRHPGFDGALLGSYGMTIVKAYPVAGSVPSGA